MANRTVQIMGYGYGSTSCSANVSYNGNTVFSGIIPTLDQAQILSLPSEQVAIFTFEIDVTAAGTFPLIMNFTGGNVVFVEQVQSNFMPVQNPIYNSSDWAIVINPASTPAQKIAVYEPLAVPPLSAADIAILEQNTGTQWAVLDAHGLSYFVTSGASNYQPIASAQCKTNVSINGSPRSPGNDPTGEWGWEVPTVSGTGTFACDLIVTAGLA